MAHPDTIVMATWESLYFRYYTLSQHTCGSGKGNDVKPTALLIILMLLTPVAMAQEIPPRPNPIDRDEMASGRTSLKRVGTIGDFEISVNDQNQSTPSSSGGIDTTINFTITYIGDTYGNPGTSLNFFASGATGLMYDRSSFACQNDTSEFDQRLFTGGELDASVCFTVHPDDADVLSLGVATTSAATDPLWLATTDESVAGAGSIATPIEIIASDGFSYTPDYIEIPANIDVPITVSNEGFMQHTLVLIGPSAEHTPLVGPLNNGDSETVMLNLPPGKYDFFCEIPGHQQSGMVGTLVVTESGESDGAPEAKDQRAKSDVSETITVAMHDDFSYSPNEISIPANTDVQLILTNEGFMQHDFLIVDLNTRTPLLSHAESETLIVNLPPGTYRFICTVAGHEQAGMTGTLIVN